MVYAMAIWITLTAIAMALSRAFPLRAGKCGVDVNQVELTVGYTSNAQTPALALDMAGIALIWIKYSLPQFSAAWPVLAVSLGLILLASEYIYLLINRFVLVVSSRRVIVQPAIGHWYAFEFDQIEHVALRHGAQGVDSLTLTVRGGRRLTLSRRMAGFNAFLARLSTEAVQPQL